MLKRSLPLFLLLAPAIAIGQSHIVNSVLGFQNLIDQSPQFSPSERNPKVCEASFRFVNRSADQGVIDNLKYANSYNPENIIFSIAPTGTSFFSRTMWVYSPKTGRFQTVNFSGEVGTMSSFSETTENGSVTLSADVTQGTLVQNATIKYDRIKNEIKFEVVTKGDPANSGSCTVSLNQESCNGESPANCNHVSDSSVPKDTTPVTRPAASNGAVEN